MRIVSLPIFVHIVIQLLKLPKHVHQEAWCVDILARSVDCSINFQKLKHRITHMIKTHFVHIPKRFFCHIYFAF